MGEESVGALREVGVAGAAQGARKRPRHEGCLGQAAGVPPVLDMAPSRSGRTRARSHVLEGDAVDLAGIPVQTCWPEDAGR